MVKSSKFSFFNYLNFYFRILFFDQLDETTHMRHLCPINVGAILIPQFISY